MKIQFKQIFIYISKVSFKGYIMFPSPVNGAGISYINSAYNMKSAYNGERYREFTKKL